MLLVSCILASCFFHMFILHIVVQVHVGRFQNDFNQVRSVSFQRFHGMLAKPGLGSTLHMSHRQAGSIRGISKKLWNGETQWLVKTYEAQIIGFISCSNGFRRFEILIMLHTYFTK